MQYLGPVLVVPRITHWMYAGFAAVVTAALLACLFFGTYTRKAHVTGWLVPRQGLMRVFAPAAGVATRIYVREGAEVARAAPLLAVSTEERSEAVGATRQRVVDQLLTRRNSMYREADVQRRMFDQQASDLKDRIAAIRSEQSNLAQQIDIQHSRITLSGKAVERAQELRRLGLTTEARIDAAMQDRLAEVAALEDLKRTGSALSRELLQLTTSLSELPLQRSMQFAEMGRNVAALGQDLAEAEARREIVITAPQDGVVASLQTGKGDGVRSDVPLMSIVPKGALLQAQLFAPSRAVGFLQEGQRVRMRYAAFPYQKFGFHEGVVASVSRSALSPSEMPQQLTGLSAVTGSTEPLYRVTVNLDEQAVTAYGKPVPLQPGMQLDADVRLERRRLIEWVFEPIFSLRAAWKR